MHSLDKTAWEVLNATADDWENLEQMYRLICFEFSAENYAEREKGAYYLRPAKGAPLLQEVADRIGPLVEAGLLEGRLEDGELPVSERSDRSYVWRAWFRMTAQGRNVWDTSEWAKLVDQEQTR
jgi:hypothetical protein